jgi:alkanesulfonate monooxygenase SsuD/methylene tetrahydromethanopterin reductase-like flavin-dependent oxidoreductase (luciferase family)
MTGVRDGWPRLAFGMTAGDRPWLGDLAAHLEALGYDELWSNDVPGRSGLQTLASAAAGTERLRLAVGALALSGTTPRRLADAVRTAGIAPDRLTVGVGSGSSRSLDMMEAGIAELRSLIPGYAIGLAAVGPRMAALGGRLADVVLLNWAGPRLAAERRAEIAGEAGALGRAAPRVAGYVRVTVGGSPRLATEQTRYRGYGGTYQAVIEDQDARGETPVGIAVDEAGLVPAALDPYRSALDTVVVRALPREDNLEAWLEVARAARLRP